MRIDNNNLLQFLLADKAILVEGATECLLIPKFYKTLFNEEMEAKKIDIISCGGVRYKNYLEIAKLLSKKVLVITDNDGKAENEPKIEENINVIMDENIENFTWEVGLYMQNKDMLCDIINIKDYADYIFNGVNYKDIGNPVLGKMLNNKVDSAMTILEVLNSSYSKYYNKIEIPHYVKKGLEWIRN